MDAGQWIRSALAEGLALESSPAAAPSGAGDQELAERRPARALPSRARLAAGRVWLGFMRPLALLAALRRRQPAEWQRFVRTVSLQGLAAVGIAVGLAALGDEAASRRAGDWMALVPSSLRWLALVVASLVTAEWVTMALSHEFHKPIARALAAVAGIAPEDDDAPPRLRVDLRWLARRLWRKLRWSLQLVRGAIASVPLLLVAAVFIDTQPATFLVLGAWTAYWWCAFTAARSARGWRDAAAGPQPWLVRWLDALVESTPGLGWFLPRWQVRLLAWASRSEAPPAVAMERDLPTMVGLGLARAATFVPVVRLAFRAAIDTAVAEALERSSGGLGAQGAQGAAPTPPA